MKLARKKKKKKSNFDTLRLRPLTERQGERETKKEVARFPDKRQQLFPVWLSRDLVPCGRDSPQVWLPGTGITEGQLRAL